LNDSYLRTNQSELDIDKGIHPTSSKIIIANNARILSFSILDLDKAGVNGY
jgi:hypothetical protein